MRTPSSNGWSDQSALGLNATRQPNTSRPVQVVGSVRVQNNEDVEGRVRVLCDSANPPTVLLKEPGYDINIDATGAPSGAVIITFSFTCPAGDRYQIATVNTQGSPSFTLETLRELIL